MNALLDALSGGGYLSWLILFAALVIGIILLRIVFEIASAVIRIGCSILFILVVAYLLFTFFG
ncbi:MAG: hypothetical protein JSV68_25125 [Anaerolineaceae bacterium]|jgi:hypothetical protein|nr:MAG: hypothetical protein JSV68_25125 [Anaerolineaceae bacterium]